MTTRFSEMIDTWLGWCPNVQMFQNVQTNTTIPPAPAQNTPAGGGDARSEREYYRRRKRGQRTLIPAGLLIGLGIGLLVGHIIAAGLIGLGLGFLGSAIANSLQRDDEHDSSSCYHKHGFGLALLGIFFVLFGIMMVWAPALLWPYIAAAFLILIGIGLLVHGFFHNGDEHWH
jgi:uncharacterized membrane protein YidH (DUF202 family)